VRLARGLIDGEVAQRLRALAAEFQAKAAKAESDPQTIPAKTNKARLSCSMCPTTDRQQPECLV
jgi:hypothetical protein